MSPIAPLLLVASLLLSNVNALATPHIAARSDIHHRHHGLAARVPIQAEANAAAPVKRRWRKRCLSRDHSSSTLAASSSAVVETVPVAVAPKPTTTKQEEPTTTAAPPAEPTTTKAPAPTTTADSGNGGDNGGNNGGGAALSGDGTFYATGLGACGITNTDTDYIVAVSHELFDSYPGYNGVNPNNNPICGKKVTAHFGGKSVDVTITDRCEGCKYGDLDFSPSAFNQLASFDLGRINPVTWNFPN